MIKQLSIIFTFILQLTIQADAYISPNEVRVPVANDGQSYVDVQSLREIINASAELEADPQDTAGELEPQTEGSPARAVGSKNKYSIEQIAQRLDEYFSSASLTVNPQGGFTLLNSKLIFNTDKISWEFIQRTPLFAVQEKVTPTFALAYATFFAKTTEQLIPTINDLIKTVDSAEWKQEHYSFYYLCLRTLAVTQTVDARVSQCLNEAIAIFNIKKSPDAFLRMANLYMKLYRASRFVFESINEKDIYAYPKVNPFYEAIDIRTEAFKKACTPLWQNFGGITQTKRRLREDSLNRLPGGLLSSLAWSFGGKEQTARNFNAIFAMPELKMISGPYFNVIENDQRYKSLYSPNYSHLCGEYWD